ncbi:MAG: GIY-YIG nuclease family protein [Terriglobia bacterium]|nr:GIY-YIG nuclease family protein [Terriglobia bacterium]
MISGIYKIENKVNGKFYIGSAVKLQARFNSHRHMLRQNRHKNAHLQAAWNKYGPDSFEFSTLLYCRRQDVLLYEQICIDGFEATVHGYNLAPIAGNTVGIVPRPESIAKMAASKRGKKKSPEALAALRAAMNRPEVRARISASCKAAIRKPKTAEHIRNAALAQIGKVIPQEQRARIAATLRGRKLGPRSPEVRAKIAASNIRTKALQRTGLIQLI